MAQLNFIQSFTLIIFWLMPICTRIVKLKCPSHEIFRKSYYTVDRNNTVYPKPRYTMDSSLLDVYAGHSTWSSYGEYDRPAFTGLLAGLAGRLLYSICGWVLTIALQHFPLQQSKFSLHIVSYSLLYLRIVEVDINW